MPSDFTSDEPLVWPSDKRSIHGEGSDWRQTASLGWSRGDAYMRIRGFRMAAELLAEHVREHRSDQDALIFPFLYNWRQHIELVLKLLIVKAEALHDIDGETPSGHNLDSLWRRCRQAVEPKGSKHELDNVELVIGELHAMDPRGDAFRYARSRTGDPNLHAVERLSFAEISTTLAGVANFLEAADTVISVELDNKRDFEREYAEDQ